MIARAMAVKRAAIDMEAWTVSADATFHLCLGKLVVLVFYEHHDETFKLVHLVFHATWK